MILLPIQVLDQVEKTGSISAAAKAMRMSRPTIYKHIRDLEFETQQTLLEGHGAQGVTLTDYGVVVLAEGRAMIEIWQRCLTGLALPAAK